MGFAFLVILFQFLILTLLLFGLDFFMLSLGIISFRFFDFVLVPLLISSLSYFLGFVGVLNH